MEMPQDELCDDRLEDFIQLTQIMTCNGIDRLEYEEIKVYRIEDYVAR